MHVVSPTAVTTLHQRPLLIHHDGSVLAQGLHHAITSHVRGQLLGAHQGSGEVLGLHLGGIVGAARIEHELADREGEEEDKPQARDLDDASTQVVGSRGLGRGIVFAVLRLLREHEELPVTCPHQYDADADRQDDR